MVNFFATVGAYLLGSLSFAVIVSKAFGMADPRSYGSGNPGATNVLRSGKKLAAVLTLLGDALKGWLAVWLALRFQAELQLDNVTIGLVAVAVIALLVLYRHQSNIRNLLSGRESKIGDKAGPE